MPVDLNAKDKALLNDVQDGFPLTSRPFREIGERLGMPESEVVERMRRLLAEGALNRLGPVLNARALGGARTLAAMRVLPERLEEVAAVVNSFDAVSHNYEREHRFNLWFVVSSEDASQVERVLAAIEAKTGLPVMALPAIEEYFVEVKFRFDA
jgi:DNA-binding Lrp family transcriptional regulator